MQNFTCPRTCPLVGKHWCQFNPIFDAIGTHRVHSHTVKISIELRDMDALRAAVNALGWEWMGRGKHRLYAETVEGYAFKPTGWSYPAILGSNGQLSTDTFEGRWGNVADLERLKAEYSTAKAEAAAVMLGWQCERTEAGLVIHHPAGGQITISGANADFAGFVGGECHEARLALGIQGDVENKPQAAQVVASVQQTTH